MVEKANILRKRIKELAKKENMSINAIATEGDIKPSTLQAFMNGHSNNPTVKIIEGVSDGLGISVKEFFDFEPYNLTPNEKSNTHEENPSELLKEYDLTVDQLKDILNIVKKQNEA